MMFSTVLTWIWVLSPSNLDAQSYAVIEGQLEPKQTLTRLLNRFPLESAAIAEAVRKAKKVFNPRDMRSGQAWKAYLERESRQLRYLVYAESPRDAVIFDFRNDIKVTRQTRSVEYVERFAQGTIQQSLFATLKKQKHPQRLALQMKALFSSEIAFSKLRKGDSFRILYEAQELDQRLIGDPRVKAASLVHKGKTYYRFLIDERVLDETGLGNQPRFLRAPIKGGAVTSHYTKRRYHPVLKRYQPHLGTDYGARKGTPIIALAHGTITKVSKNRYNGRYVKIRHDRVYESQYLHMTRWAKDLQVGQKVRQGDVIGYVGNTGLAHGYHVCLRLWKHGKQVDFCKQQFPKSKEKIDPKTQETIRQLKLELDQGQAW